MQPIKTNSIPNFTILIFLFLFFTIGSLTPLNAQIPDRRSTTSDEALGWLLAPAPISISGVGSAVLLTGLLSNFYETTDVMAVTTLGQGDFDMTVMTLQEFPIVFENVLLYTGTYRQKIPFTAYERGIESDKDEFILPLSQHNGIFGQIKLNFFERRWEVMYQMGEGTSHYLKVFDKDGNEFADVDHSERKYSSVSYATMVDLTDSRTDPRRGIRLGARAVIPTGNSDSDVSDYYTANYNMTAYLPMFDSDTLVFNAFRSSATVTREGIIDEAEMRQKKGLGCVQGMPLYELCYAAETQKIKDQLAANRFGTAASLGGPNRLRAYDIGRFRAANSAYLGVEYRYNFSAEANPVNLYFLGGIKTLFQFAFFAEQGSVHDDASKLFEVSKPSYGAGFRAIISGLIYRFDIATGDEGTNFSLFIDYPMELNPIAS